MWTYALIILCVPVLVVLIALLKAALWAVSQNYKIYVQQRKAKKQIQYLPLNYGLGQIIEELDRTKLFNAMLSFSRDKQWNEDGIYLMTFLGFPIVIVNNPAHVKKICITQASKFPKSSNTTGNLSLFMGKGLVTSSGDLWKKQRGLLNNFFSPEPISQMMDKMAYHTNVYLEQWKPDTKGEFEVTDFTSKITELTLRIVIACVFGSDLRTLDDMTRLWKGLGESFIPVMVAASVSHTLLNLPLPSFTRFANCKKELSAKVNELIDVRREELIKEHISSENVFESSDHTHMDMLSLMILSATDRENNEIMSKQQIIDETYTFLAAGHETTSSLMLWLFYHLAKYPHMQKKVQDEMDSVLGTNRDLTETPTYEQIKDLVYLKMMMNETMRMFPPIISVDKEAGEDMDFGEYRIAKGTQVSIDIVGLQRNEKIWENPDVFDPERWEESRIKQIPEVRTCYMPFSLGARNCIGQIFTNVEVPLATVRILSEYNVSFADGYSQEIKFDGSTSLKPANLRVKFTPRQ